MVSLKMFNIAQTPLCGKKLKLLNFLMDSVLNQIIIKRDVLSAFTVNK